MALPILVKTYEIDPNNTGGIASSNLEDNQRTMFALKEALTGGGSAEITTKPMTVSRSSDASSAGAADYWVDFLDLVWSAGAHSWIVLKSAGDITFEICIDLGDVNPYHVGGIIISPSGAFAGGDASNRPTAGDEFTAIATNNAWCGLHTTTFVSKVHAMISTDGNVITAFVFVNNKMMMMWRFDIVADSVSGWADALHYWVQSSTATGTHLLTHSQIALGTGKFIEEAGSVYGTLFSYEAYNSTELNVGLSQVVPNDLDSAWPMSPVGFWSQDVGARGKLGTLTDIWWVHDVLNAGDQLPGVPTPKQFSVLKNMAIPWDSSTVIQTA